MKEGISKERQRQIAMRDYYRERGKTLPPLERFSNNWSMPAGIVGLPPSVDRVLALRRADAGVPVDQVESLYRSGLDEFEQTGVPTKFLILPPACVDLTFPTYAASVLANRVLVSTNGPGADDGRIVRVKLIDQAGEEFSESVTLSSSGPIYLTNNRQWC